MGFFQPPGKHDPMKCFQCRRPDVTINSMFRFIIQDADFTPEEKWLFERLDGLFSM